MAKRSPAQPAKPLAHMFVEDLSEKELQELTESSRKWRQKFAARKKVIHHSGRITKALLAVQVKTNT